MLLAKEKERETKGGLLSGSGVGRLGHRAEKKKSEQSKWE